MIETYRALALQVRCEAVNSYTHYSESKKYILNNIVNVGQSISASKAFIGSDLKLVVLPEYVLTGFPMGEDFLQWQQKACLVKDGAEYRELGKIAQKNNMYIAGNAYECDEHFPNLYFQSCFIIAPEGNVALRYRRLNSLYSPTPHDVWNKYLEIYGYESLFPVLNSPLGRLACVASEEILFPELTAFVHSGNKTPVKNSGLGTSRMGDEGLLRFLRHQTLLLNQSSIRAPWWHSEAKTN